MAKSKANHNVNQKQHEAQGRHKETLCTHLESIDRHNISVDGDDLIIHQTDAAKAQHPCSWVEWSEWLGALLARRVTTPTMAGHSLVRSTGTRVLFSSVRYVRREASKPVQLQILFHISNRLALPKPAETTRRSVSICTGCCWLMVSTLDGLTELLLT